MLHLYKQILCLCVNLMFTIAARCWRIMRIDFDVLVKKIILFLFHKNATVLYIYIF